MSWSGGVRGGRSGSWWCRRGGVAVAVEGARAMRALAYVEAEPDVDISGFVCVQCDVSRVTAMVLAGLPARS